MYFSYRREIERRASKRTFPWCLLLLYLYSTGKLATNRDNIPISSVLQGFQARKSGAEGSRLSGRARKRVQRARGAHQENFHTPRCQVLMLSPMMLMHINIIICL